MRLATLLALWFMTSIKVNALSTCSQLTDLGSPFITSIMAIAGVPIEQTADLPIMEAFKTMEMTMPVLSKCVANIDISITATNLLGNPEMEKCFSILDTMETSGEANNLNNFLYDTMCPMLVDTAIPCIQNIVLAQISTALAETNTCCDTLQQDLSKMFGTNMENIITDVMKLMTNVLCSTRITNNAKETCGFSLASTILANLDIDTMGEQEQYNTTVKLLKSILQIPNNQVCKAVNAKPFTTTNGDSFTITAINSNPIGSCYQPIDALITYVSNFPILQNMLEVDLSNMFKENTCINGVELVKALKDIGKMLVQIFDLIESLGGLMVDDDDSNYPTPHPTHFGEWKLSGSGSLDNNKDDSEHLIHNTSMIFRQVFEILEGEMIDMCLHMPNGVQCSENKNVVVVFSDIHPPVQKTSSPTDTPTTTATRSKTPAPTDESTPASRGANLKFSLMSAMFAIALVALI